jgi:hypothetical protein
MRNYDWVKFTTGERINARYKEAEAYRLTKAVSTGSPLYSRLLDGARSVVDVVASLVLVLRDLSKRQFRTIRVGRAATWGRR